MFFKKALREEIRQKKEKRKEKKREEEKTKAFWKKEKAVRRREEQERAKLIREQVENYRKKFPVGSLINILKTEMIVIDIGSNWPANGFFANLKYMNNNGELSTIIFPIQVLEKASENQRGCAGK